jgi:lactate permease
MFQQDTQAVGDSLLLSALCALIPLAVLFVLLGGLKVRAWISGLIALLVALVDGVPPSTARCSASSRSCGS